mgnify:CR=1 FL=1
MKSGQPRWRRSLRRDKELESDDRSASSLASSNPGGAAFANCILGVADCFNEYILNLKESSNSFYPKLIFIEGVVKCGKISSEIVL